MAHNTRKLVGVILMLSLLVAALAAFTITASADTSTTVSVKISDYASTNGWTNSVKYPTVEMDSYITVTANGGGNTGKYYTSGNEWRIYQTETPSVVVSGADGVTISTVTITYNVSNTGVLTLNGSNVTSGTTVTVNANSVTFGVGNSGTKTNGQVKITAIEVVYTVAAGAACQHTGGTATCKALAKCELCGEEYGDYGDHVGGTATCNALAKCDTCGQEYGSYGNHAGGTATCNALAKCDTCGQEYGDFAEHNYVGGVCDVCGDEEATELTTKYVFADYAAGAQYAEGEIHVLDDVVTVTTTQCHFTTQLRIYSSSTYNGFAIIESTRTISKIVLNAGNKVDTLNVYGSTDGSTWNLIQAVSVTSTSYNDYTVSIDPNLKYKQLKLDVAGEQQIRVANFTLTTVSDSAEVHTHVFDNGVVTAPTCFTKGYTTYTCTATGCGYSYTDDETDATGHSCVDGWCTVCGHAEPDTFLTIPDAKNFADLLNGKESPAKYYMTVIVDEVTDTDWGNMNVKDSEGNTFVIYGLYSADGKTRYDAMETKPVVGDVITVYGVIVRYGTSTYEMKNGWVTDIHEHAYDTAEVVVVEDVPFVSYKCACGDKKVKNVATFKGASIRYKDGASVEQLAVRFGYQFDPNIIEYIVGWSWDYEAIDGNAVISGTVDGTAITAAGVSNLVFTDIPTKRIDATFKVTLTLVLEIDGTEYTYTEAEANERVISNVLTAIKDDTTEAQEARDYAQEVLEAFANLPADDETNAIVNKEEEN